MNTSLTVYGNRGEVSIVATTDFVTSDNKIARDPLFVASRASNAGVTKLVVSVDDVDIEAVPEKDGWKWAHDGAQSCPRSATLKPSASKKKLPLNDDTRDWGPDVLMCVTAIAKAHFPSIVPAARGGGSKSDTKAVISAKLDAVSQAYIDALMGAGMSEEDARAKLASIVIVNTVSDGQEEARKGARERAVES